MLPNTARSRRANRLKVRSPGPQSLKSYPQAWRRGSIGQESCYTVLDYLRMARNIGRDDWPSTDHRLDHCQWEPLVPRGHNQYMIISPNFLNRRNKSSKPHAPLQSKALDHSFDAIP
jgi:hypothetical protein